MANLNPEARTPFFDKFYWYVMACQTIILACFSIIVILWVLLRSNRSGYRRLPTQPRGTPQARRPTVERVKPDNPDQGILRSKRRSTRSNEKKSMEMDGRKYTSTDSKNPKNRVKKADGWVKAEQERQSVRSRE